MMKHERNIERLVSKPLAETILAGSIESGPVVGSLREGTVVFWKAS